MTIKNSSNMAALLMALVAVGGFIFSIVQYGIDTRNQEKVQKASYEATAKGLEELTIDVTREIKVSRDEIQMLKIDVAVLKDRTRRIRSVSLDVDSTPTEVVLPQITKQPMKKFSEVQKSALAE